MIRDVDAVICEIPLRHTGSLGVGRLERVMNVIVRVRTHEGVVGYGEASPWPVFAGTAEGILSAIREYLAPAVLGLQETAIASLHEAMDSALAGHPFAKGGIDLAVHDAVARALGVPLVQLLGGPVRDRVRIGASLSQQDLQRDADEAQRLLEAGVSAFKVKVGVLDLDADMERLAAIRDVVPAHGEFRIDFNQGCAPETARMTVARMETLRPSYIEQPLAAWNVEGMAELKRAMTVPLMADESVFSPHDAARVARLGAADIISIKLMKCGGIHRARQIADICEAFGMAAYAGAMWESGVGIAAALHFACSQPAVRHGSDFYVPYFLLEDDVLEQPLRMEGGYMILPDGPGIGVRPDLERVRAYARSPMWRE